MAEKEINQTIAEVFQQMANTLETGRGISSSIALTALGSEHGEAELYQAARMAADRGISVKVIGTQSIDYPGVESILVSDEEASHQKLEGLLETGKAQAGVTMHYPFPIGVSTVGRVITPAKGKPMYLATTTGTSALNRVEALVRNTLYGIMTAKACGIKKPTVGLLNIDGARQTEIVLKRLAENGYPIHFAESNRSDGGAVMRGNDALAGTCDILVMDSLTGNILQKVFSSYHTGGNYESLGFGYGPGVGEAMDQIIMIVSRASGAPVICGAIEFADELVRGNFKKIVKDEMAKAKQASLETLLKEAQPQKEVVQEEIAQPDKEIVTEEIHGVEILDLEDAVRHLWKQNVYAESGMGCTGPVVMISEKNTAKAKEILSKAGYIG
ncbi:glycine/betaine reductase C [Enterococcus florum]|uniref:Glycine/betaine reductase C n=1 Tax=Enterococcus florum TaxID=2480627 RepID=A0A4P5P3C4_9ENTE|nr:glycine/sarcosine/betaine reductase complex component C subunit alpha [Enterococcus florum]GCF92235.1 glycine/betaine reductase C [Enterococcus florum]